MSSRLGVRRDMFNTKSAVKTVSFMMIATLTAKMLGMLRDMLLAVNYGTGWEAEAFLTAIRIPIMFFDIGLGAAISSTFIPVFNTYLQNEDKEKAIRFSNNFVNIVLLITALITFLGILFARQLAGFIAPGLDEQTILLTIRLMHILFPMIVFTGLAYSYVGILQSLNEFNIPAAISLVSNAIVIIYFIFFNRSLGIFGLAVAMLVGWAAQVIVQIPSLKKKGYAYRPVLDFKSEGIRKVALLTLPILISTWVQPINGMVNLRLATNIQGGIAALEYAYRLFINIGGIFTYALTNLIFPSLSRMSAGENREQFAKLMTTALRTVIYFVTPLMVGFMTLRVPLVQLIYERGAFGAASTEITAVALLFYAMGILGFAVQETMSKGFYALHEASTPMKVAVGGITLNIILSFVFFRYLELGVGGLALAASVASTVIAVTLVVVMHKKIKGIFNMQVLIHFLKVVFAVMVMGIVVMGIGQILDIRLGSTLTDRVLRLGIPVIAGVLTYGIVTFMLGVKEAKVAWHMIKDQWKRV